MKGLKRRKEGPSHVTDVRRCTEVPCHGGGLAVDTTRSVSDHALSDYRVAAMNSHLWMTMLWPRRLGLDSKLLTWDTEL